MVMYSDLVDADTDSTEDIEGINFELCIAI
jgi:hypothetical protein